MRDKTLIRFVKALVNGQEVSSAAGRRGLECGGVLVPQAAVARLITERAVSLLDGRCIAGPLARDWLRRQLASMPETEVAPSVNLDESPLARLAAVPAGGEKAFLDAHQVEAGERVRRLYEQAHLQPRLTMSYSAGHTRGRNRQGGASEISDLASAARRALREIHAVLPADCAGVVMDVCGYLKGLQVVEQERGWPRRSAKLVLRIGLEQLAQHFGYASAAAGPARAGMRIWLDDEALPQRFE